MMVVHAILATMEHQGWDALPDWFSAAYDKGGVVICPASIYVGKVEAGFNDWLQASADGGLCVVPRADAMENRGMPLSSKEKQEAFRARQSMLGLKEVRGIYLPEAMHDKLKQIAAELLKKEQK
jgi:hypothetical protein